MTARHSPGPWCKDKNNTLLDRDGHAVIEYAAGVGSFVGPNQLGIANTELRNASPELVDALEKVLRHLPAEERVQFSSEIDLLARLGHDIDSIEDTQTIRPPKIS